MLGKRNLSNEILHFYLQAIYLLKNKNFFSTLSRNYNDEEAVGMPRALDTFKELFEKIIPIEIFPTLRKKVETLLIKEDSSPMGITSVDVDKFLDYCNNIYQRFHLNFQNRL